MDLQLLSRTRDFSRRRKRWLLLSALFGASAYGAYRVYHSPSMTRKRKKVARLIGALFSMLEIVSDSAETIGVVSGDLKQFLSSDSDEIPNSLRQISKIAQSDQLYRSVDRISEALTIGVMKGYRSQSKDDDESSITDQIMDRVLSNAGSGFVSVVAGSFAKNLVLGYFGSREAVRNGMAWNDGGSSASMVDVVFVSTAVAAYLDKTLDVNMYDELFAGLSNPKHGNKVRDMLVSVCNGAVETLVKTSHQVLTNSKADVSCCSNGEDAAAAADLTKRWVFDQMQSSGLANSISSTLAVPSNRRFVLDMTGRVTFETLRSILLDGSRRGANFVRDRAVERGKEVVRYMSTKSSVIVTLCVALYLHVVGGTRIWKPGAKTTIPNCLDVKLWLSDTYQLATDAKQKKATKNKLV
ncbi:hypothetical protein V2J09_007470 [Rumex salicifolius]